MLRYVIGWPGGFLGAMRGVMVNRTRREEERQ